MKRWVAWPAAAVLSLLSRPLVAQSTIPDSASSLIASDEVRSGWRLFHINCFRCHGFDAMNGSAPDLRVSVKTLSQQAFITTVENGRPDRGMPAWGEMIPPSDALLIYDYIMARSTGALGPGKPVAPPAPPDSIR